MKTIELMIGDWVMLNPDLKEYYDFAGNPCQVIGLNDGEGAIKIDYDNGKYFWTDAEDDIEPILLTPEILEKNGFTRYGQVFANLQQWVGEFGDKRKSLFQDVLTGEWEINDVWIDYVHELQHALKLCRIDKELII